MNDSVIKTGPGGMTFVGEDATNLFRAKVIESGLRLYAKTGMKPNRAYTPTAMLKAAGQITGKTYKARQYVQAADDLKAWSDAMAAAIPIVKEGATPRYQVWYMRPEFFAAGVTGRLPDAKNLDATHALLKTVETGKGLAGVFHMMQGENWSPAGEARALIESKGLQHTSMCVGDVIVDDVGNVHVVAPVGFKAIGGNR